MSVDSDVMTLHRIWMSMLYKRQSNPHPVAGRFQPSEKGQKMVYFLWYSIGLPVSIAGYLLALLGKVLKIFVDKIVEKSEDLGLDTTLLVSAVAWIAVASVIYFIYGQEDAVAFGISSIIAILSIIIAFLSRWYGTTKYTILISYPATYTAIFLPPVSAALIVPEIANIVLPFSVDVTNTILNTAIFFEPLESMLITTFELEGTSHLVLWFLISTVLGWFTGVCVKLAELVYKNA